MSVAIQKRIHSTVATINACKLCTPLGACLAFRGIEGCVPFLHGSQGCATYIRRYLISHFREPMDVASSSFSESTAIYGGGDNLKAGLINVTRQYNPDIIGVATTCLSETIGDDVRLYLSEYRGEHGSDGPILTSVSTPSYQGTHIDGFHGAVRSIVEQLAEGGPKRCQINLLPGLVSPADLRHLKEILSDFGLNYTILPDYSETLDGPAAREYDKIPKGGTTISSIREMGTARATVELGDSLQLKNTAAKLLKDRFEVPRYVVGLPIGVNETDCFFTLISHLSLQEVPEKYVLERGRLIDAYVDGHKYVFGKRAVIYGDEDMVIGLASFLLEVGITPIICATGGENSRLSEKIRSFTPATTDPIMIQEGVDFMEIATETEKLSPDLMIGSSKGYSIARKLGIPLIRVGFPIHDRFGGHRTLHLGYKGAQILFDRIVNAILEHKQETSPVGYSYM